MGAGVDDDKSAKPGFGQMNIRLVLWFSLEDEEFPLEVEPTANQGSRFRRGNLIHAAPCRIRENEETRGLTTTVQFFSHTLLAGELEFRTGMFE